jgi:NAD(P)H-dependent FMN reductase
MTPAAARSQNREVAARDVTARDRAVREVVTPLRTPTRVPPGDQHRIPSPDDDHLRTSVPNHTGRPRIVALSGDPDPGSGESRLLVRSDEVVPGTVVIDHELSLAGIPPFETTAGRRPPTVVRLEEALAGAGGLIIASPPVTGHMAEPVRRLVDWLAGTTVLDGLPTAVLNTAIVPDAHLAHAELIEALSSLGAVVVSRACLAVPGTDRAFDDDGALVLPFVIDTLWVALAFLAEAVLGGDRRN